MAGAVVVACKFGPAPSGHMIDAFVLPDAGLCSGITAECAGSETLRTCLGSGQMSNDTVCSWGCLGPSAHCGKLAPTGGGVLPTDLDPDPMLGDIPLVGTIDGNNGGISGLRPAGSPGQIINGIGYYVRGNVAVFRFKTIRITGNQLALGGDHPIALVATGDILVDDQVDVQGSCSGSAAGPGGFHGGAAGSDAGGSGGGSGGSTDAFAGGGGGGNGSDGGSGGNGPATVTGLGAAGTAFGDAMVTVLIGGGGGGGGGHGASPIGGGGGGALQLVANGTITISTNGEINAGGCGGSKGAAGDSGGGGGAGGTIVLEAHDLFVTGKLGVNGGGGGAGGGGNDGANAVVARGATNGGPGGNADGGSGAGGATLVGSPGKVGSARSGGGGGGIGRMRFTTYTGLATVDNTNLSPALDDNPTTCTLGSAAVQ